MNDGSARQLSDLREKVASLMKISNENRAILLPSKTQSVFDNRCNWASYYLMRAGLLKRPKRGVYQITEVGSDYIREHNGYGITLEDLDRYESFLEFKKAKRQNGGGPGTAPPEETPEDQMNDAFQLINKRLADDILNELMNLSPIFFEKLVLDLLNKMGYGGKNEDAIIHTPISHDGGIDGLIKEDELGLDHVYVQAKRWTNPVHVPEIQKFAGALSGQGARKGVFITTSTFSKGAIEFANRHVLSKMVLVDGEKLAELMIIYGVGLSVEYEYKLQKIDRDYFDEER